MLRSWLKSAWLLAICAIFVASQPVWSAAAPVDPLQNRGWIHFYNLEYGQAMADFEQQLRENPSDATAYNALAQGILYREMYRDGALESQMVTGNNPFLRRPKMEVSSADAEAFTQAIAKSLQLSEAKLAKNSDDFEALYELAVAHGLRANYLFLVEKAWMQALHESITGRKANDQILRIAPNLKEAHLIQGMTEYVVACMPKYLRVLGAINGFHADKEDGIRQLEIVSRSDSTNRFDADIMLVAILRREHRPGEALPLLNQLAREFPRNYLLRLEQVQMYSDLGDKTSALKVLAFIDEQRRKGAPGYAAIPEARVQFARGNLLFWYGDLNGAKSELKQVTARSEDLDLSTAVLAWLRLGQLCDLAGDHSNAQQAYRETIKMAPKSEVALEAKSYLDKPYHRRRSDEDKTL